VGWTERSPHTHDGQEEVADTKEMSCGWMAMLFFPHYISADLFWCCVVLVFFLCLCFAPEYGQISCNPHISAIRTCLVSICSLVPL
jgi:hypothetical protein